VRFGPVTFEDRLYLADDSHIADDDADLASAIELDRPETLAANERLLAVADNGSHMEPEARVSFDLQGRPHMASLANDSHIDPGGRSLRERSFLIPSRRDYG
jgi:hypothetical protein